MSCICLMLSFTIWTVNRRGRNRERCLYERSWLVAFRDQVLFTSHIAYDFSGSNNSEDVYSFIVRLFVHCGARFGTF